ncbi:NAD(P)H-dependent oxidoreductase [Frigoriflavimonas asaccharolytica]|uniref:Nitroreductase n=1 Tax=Frigoriflavimonas asaccharolytica TaxID=2735899 RepID=A0A8J8G7N1_9FLAO|nr:NAD(P)H-dependent oxidoreductase [Frigoriflavimonas asaccharolytica]NRS92180.1 nitroreductase [Frigoriflavimonas asaccharolytica]
MYLEALQQRYSVKKFDKEKSVPAENLNNILRAGQLSASSLGLQPYEILVVETEALKQKLIPAFYNPSQISTCSHLIVIVSKKNLDENYLGSYFQYISKVREVELETLDPFKKNINSHITRLSDDEMSIWAEKQCYIVLGNLMFAAALENVDTCPMEGFKKEELEKLLELDQENLSISVTLALGFRAEDDIFQNFKKVRKPDDKLFKFL